MLIVVFTSSTRILNAFRFKDQVPTFMNSLSYLKIQVKHLQ